MKASLRTAWKRTGLVCASALALFSGWVWVNTETRLHAHYAVDVAPVSVPHDYPTIARGSHVVHSLAKCTGCHGDDLGGRVLADSPMIGRLSAPNLTTPEIVSESNEDLLRALVHGVARDGRPLLLMPSHEIAELGEQDLSAVLAYLRTVPPVFREVRPIRVGPLLRVLLALKKADLIAAERIDHTSGPKTPPPAEPNAAYGEHLAKSGGCFGCHGPSLAGGPIPGMPPGTPRAADIRAAALAAWTYEDFERAIRKGVRPDGRALAEIMPWRAMAGMSDDEVRALYAYLKGTRDGRSASNL